MCPHDVEGEEGRQKTEREKEEPPQNNRRVRLLVHCGAIIRISSAQSNVTLRSRQEGKNRWKIAVDERSKNMLIRSAIGRTSQSLIVLLTITAWFILSNHCVMGLGLAGSQPAAPDESTGCPMHSTPAKKKEPTANIPCCKDLRALAAKSVVTAMGATLRLACSEDYAAEIFLAPPRFALEIENLDTGPPDAASFAESVLQQSLLAHAPPSP
jgi:hypothetical protein